MSASNKKTPREFQCRGGLWKKFEAMASELECSVDYLINDAMKQYARQRGYANESSQVGTNKAADAPSPKVEQKSPTAGAAPPPAPGALSPSAGAPSPHSATPQRGGALGGLPPTPPAVPTPPPIPAVVTVPPPIPVTNAGPPPIPPGAGNPPPLPSGAALAPGLPPGLPSGGPRASSNLTVPLSPSRIPPIAPGGGAKRPPPPPSASMAPRAPLPGEAAPAIPNTGILALTIHYQGQPFQVTKDRFIIGRGKSSSDLTIRDPNVSRQHALVEFSGGNFYMVDMGSTNGVEFNGQRVQRKTIQNGDVYRVCDHELYCSMS